MKSKLAVFDFDSTIRDDDPNQVDSKGNWQMGVGHLFPEGIVYNYIKTVSSYSLSFYRSKMILDHPNCFVRIQIVLVGSKSFWSGPNHFGQVQIRFNCTIPIIWTSPKNLDGSKLFWTIAGQSINVK